MTRSTAEVEARNMAEIERLNQRGGRMLSVIDLIEDGTLTAEMASLIAVMVEAGSSFLTGAVPGGAGKTTLMASMLSFLPEGEPILAVGDRAVLGHAAAAGGPLTVMPHELGAGRWYGYIWGSDVVEFFALQRAGVRRVSCLHADNPAQTEAVLGGLGVGADDWEEVGMLAYMAVDAGRSGVLRRVDALHCRLGGELLKVFAWRPGEDRFEPELERPEADDLMADEFGLSLDQVDVRRRELESLIAELRSEGVRDYARVRERIVRQRSA
jgi:hypothetical protein